MPLDQGIFLDKTKAPQRDLSQEIADAEIVGISVKIGDRALALTNAIDYFNNSAKVRGFARQVETPGSDAWMRYDHPEHVRDCAKTKLSGKKRTYFDTAIDTLAAADSMRNAGYNESEIDVARRGVVRDLNEKFGATSNAKKRKLALNKVTKSSKIIVWD